MADWALLVVDKALCVGTGMCCQLAPDAVTLGADRKADPHPEPMLVSEAILEAIDSCPTQALRLERRGPAI